MRSLPIALALSLGLVSTAALATGSQKEITQAEHRSTVYAGLLSGGDHGELSTFVDLMNKLFSQEELQGIFDGKESFTLFAPTNAAFEDYFAALSEEERAKLQDLNSGVLEGLLYHHITRGAWNQPTGAIKMLDDSVAQTYRADHDFKIEQATILHQDRYRNGIVATIDSVMPNEAAKATVNFVNCADEKVFFDVYGGGDIFCVVPSSIAGVDPNGGRNSVFCNDTNRGCQIRKASASTPGSCGHFVYAKDGQTVVNKQYSVNVYSGTVTCASTPP
jgi:uncharacterized surface protein with fasciclin (FAS1) repeats